MAEEPMPQSQYPPISLPPDTQYVYGETQLEGHRIVCFTVGGEPRLCLGQVLRVIHGELGGEMSGLMPQVLHACQELFIHLSRCTEEQLELLKRENELHPMADGCGLIRKTDAERLVNKLIHSHPVDSDQPLTRNSFEVFHSLDPKCKGVIIPELYITASAKCIKCVQCNGLFSTKQFVGHTHRCDWSTMHWGFDPMKWRYYLHLVDDDHNKQRLQSILNELKCQFSIYGQLS